MSNILLGNGQFMSPNGYNLGYSMSNMAIHSPLQPLQPIAPYQPNNFYTTLQERSSSLDYWRGGWEKPKDDPLTTFPFLRGY